MPPVRILIADDHGMIRQGVRRVLEARSGWEICGEAMTGREAVTLTEELRPDVVILDFTMPELNGVDAAIRIRQALPAPRIVMLTMHDSESLRCRLMEAGVQGFLVKADAGEELVAAVEAVLVDRPYFAEPTPQSGFGGHGDPPATKALSATESAGAAEGGKLTAREREIVQLIAEGMSSKEIAVDLRISLKTVETHRTHILEKLHARSVTDVVRFAIREGLIPP